VRFLVDRQTVWIDAEPPYSYGEEGAYLATSYFYSPYSDKEGQSGHRFTVRVNGMEGVWREHVVARVQKPRIAKRAPTYGIWGRLPPDAVTNPRPTGEVGPYTAWLYMVGGALWVGRTVERAYIYELAAADPRRFRIGVPIFMGSHDQAGGRQGWFFKGYQCALDGPPATYALSWTKRFGAFNERHLVLTASTSHARSGEGSWGASGNYSTEGRPLPTALDNGQRSAESLAGLARFGLSPQDAER
jgi:hypothetical protein